MITFFHIHFLIVIIHSATILARPELLKETTDNFDRRDRPATSPTPL
jgi:hypothetical protein